MHLTAEEDSQQDTEALEEEPQKTEGKKKKPLTKYAVVKKLQKKNLQVNTRVVFDEEGEEILDPRKQQVRKEGGENWIQGSRQERRREKIGKEEKVGNR